MAKSNLDEYSIAIFKSRDDVEPVQQWALSGVTDCSVQMLAKRKQGPVLPTLVVTMAEKEKKRRSSRAGSLIPAGRDSAVTVLWFRTPPDDHQSSSLQEWARFIQYKRSMMGDENSPITPTSAVNFSPRSKDASDYFPRPGSGPADQTLQHKSSTTTYSTAPRERPVTYSSHSPSLRSRRSDISSPSSTAATQTSNYPIPGQHYTTVLPTDLPSPINTTGDYHTDRVDGWVTTKARSSTLSSPIRPRESLVARTQHPGLVDSSSPPGPRETHLDRAFQMRYMSAAARKAPGEEKLSSVARFDALMREADEKRKQKEAAERAEQSAIRSAFEDDDSSEPDNSSDTDDTDSDVGHMSSKDDNGDMIPHSAQRALHYIASRPGQTRPSINRNNLSFHAHSATTSLTREPPARPHTAHEKNRRDIAQRAQSTHYLPSLPSAELAAAAGKIPEDGAIRTSGEPAPSNSSNKRLSFTEFTKRLSSTSSLLLVQTNASGNSSQRNSEIEYTTAPRTSLRPPGPGPAPRDRDRLRDEKEKRCSWRGGVSVAGGEGGFF
jgi:hypothetical protein